MKALEQISKALEAGPTPDWALGRHGAIVGGEWHEFTLGRAQRQIAMACVTDDDKQLVNAAYMHACNPANIRSLLDYVAQLERDAKRYQWLRSRVYKEEGRLHCAGPCVDDYAFGFMADALDTAIDAAIGGHT